MTSKSEFWCETCGVQKKSYTREEIVEHAKTVHGITEFKGEKRGVMFMDGDKFYQNTYEWEIGKDLDIPLKITQVDSGTRKHMYE